MTLYIYIITNIIDNKKYIGQTNNPKKRWLGHKAEVKRQTNHPLYSAIKKYGLDNFSFNIIDQKNTQEEIDEAEKYWIEVHKTNIIKYGNEYGYNLTEGGKEGGGGWLGRKHLDDSKKKMSEAKIGVKNPFYGKEHSEEAKKRIGAASKERQSEYKPMSEDTKKKMSKIAKHGEDHPDAKLTWDQVSEIKSKYIPYKYSAKKLSLEYGVCETTIVNIITGKKWKTPPII